MARNEDLKRALFEGAKIAPPMDEDRVGVSDLPSLTKIDQIAEKLRLERPTKKVKLSAYIDQRLEQQLFDLHRRTGRSLSSVVEQALADYLSFKL